MKTQTVTLKLAATGDFANFGQSVVAYVKKTHEEGADAYTIYGANGERIAAEDTEAHAMQTAQGMNLFPVVVQ
ncbi:MAG: hypothetical protein KGQ41_00265 [Alphaproteobacteria bacterium]|nr:hypothetical protein [Alphaproteobacteria bacterium]